MDCDGLDVREIRSNADRLEWKPNQAMEMKS